MTTIPWPPDVKTRRALAGGAALLAALGLYLAYPDKVFVLDGVFYGVAIERHVVNLRATLLNPRHLLFLSTLMILRDALSAAGLTIDGYSLIQRVNACAGVLGLWVYSRLIARISGDRTAAAIAAAALGVSYCYWSRATEGQTYMIMTFGAICVLAAAARLLEKPSPGRALAMAAIWLAAFLFHSANAALFPAAAAALWLAAPAGRRRVFMIPSAVLVLSAALAVLWVLGIRSSEALLRYLADDFGGRSLAVKVSGWSSLVTSFFHPEGSRFGTQLSLSLEEIFTALIVSSLPSAAQAAAGALMGVGAAAATAAAWPRFDPTRRRIAAVIAAAGLGEAALSTFWPGGIFFWASPLAAVLALSALSGAKLLEGADTGRRRRVLGAAAALALALGAWNFREGILPQSRLENNDGYVRARFVGEHTLTTSWVMISGLGFGNSKVYLTKFARRSNRVLEFFLDSGPKAAALVEFKMFLQDAIDHGLPVYALSDLVDDPAVAEHIRDRYGVTPEEVKECFGPGEFRLVASYDASLRVYLFVPADRRDRLFAGLTFNVLDMNDPAHINEIAPVMMRLAAEMTPDQRRGTAELLKDTRYGATMALAGMSPYLDAATRPQAEAYARGFMSAPGPQSLDLIRAIERLLAAR